MTYELYHHGILGMKWGIRRYQNKDGSLTAEGRKRYGVEAGQITTNSVSGFRAAAHDIANDENLQSQIKNAIKHDKELLDSAKQYKDACDALGKATSVYGEKLEKEYYNGEEWDGDGTELHQEMLDHYPEYKSVFQREQRALLSLINNAKRFAESNHGIEKVKSYPNYFDKHKEGKDEWYYKANAFAAAVADVSTDGYASTFLYSENFIEYYYKNKKGLFERAKYWLEVDPDDI